MNVPTQPFARRGLFPFALMMCWAAATLAAQGALTLSTTTPANGARAVERDADMTVAVSEAVDPASINELSIVVHSSRVHRFVENAAWGIGGTSATALLNPAKEFAPGEEVEVTVRADERGWLRRRNGGPIGQAPIYLGLVAQSGAVFEYGRVFRFRAKAGAGPASFSQNVIDFSPGSAPATASNHAVACGDMNGDGFIDIVFSAEEAAVNLRGLKIAFNDGIGGFTDSVLYTADLSYVHSIDIGDADNDGDLDIIAGRNSDAAASGGKTYLSLLKNNSGSFTEAIIRQGFATSMNVIITAVRFGDMDGDGHLDIVSGIRGQASGGSTNRIHFNDSKGNYYPNASGSPANSIVSVLYIEFGSSSEATTDLRLGDIDGDGDLDVLTVTSGGNNTIYLNDGEVYTGDGYLKMTLSTSMLGNNAAASIALGDFDGDGHLDAAVGGLGTNTWYKNNGAGVFSAQSSFGSGDTYGLESGDVDGDGDLDLLVGNRGSQGRVYLNNGSGNFGASPVAYGDAAGQLHRVALADIDGDADLDIVGGDSASNQKIFYNGDLPLTMVKDAQLPDAREGFAYTTSFGVVNGNAPYQWTLVSAPLWLGIDAATGTLSGTPPGGSGGTQPSFDVTVRDNGGAGAAVTRSFSLAVRPPPVALPFFENCENGIDFYGLEPAANARALNHAAAAKSGTLGLVLESTAGNANWPLQTANPQPGQAAADDPARWAADGGSHHGILEWAVDGAGQSDLTVSFDYKITYTFQKWYANLLFEWSDDLGQTWQGASDTGSAVNHIYRGDQAGVSGAAWKAAGIQLQGLSGQGFVRFRFRWLVKFSKDDSGQETSIAIDNLAVFPPGQSPLLTLSPATLVDAQEGVAYAQSLSASGGTPPYAWSVSGLPSGGWLGWNAATATLSGTPPVGSAPQTVSITVTLTDAASGSETQVFDIDVVNSVRLVAGSLSGGTEGTSYGPTSLQRSGGIGPFTWAIIGGSLPPGLQLDAAAGTISGTPAKGAAGTHTLTVEITDTANGDKDSGDLVLIVTSAPPLTITGPTDFPLGLESQPFSVTIQASGGFAPYTFSHSGLPAWLNLDTATGVISGTPGPGVAPQISNISITVTDSDSPGASATRSYLLIVTSASSSFTNSTLPTLGGAGGCVMHGGATGVTLPVLLLLLGAACVLRTRRIALRR